MCDCNENADALRAVKTPRRKWLSILWTIAASIALVAVGPSAYTGPINKLGTPETAMVGIDRNEAIYSIFGAFAVISFALLIITLKHLISPHDARLAAIPLLALLPAHFFFERATEDVELVPAFESNYLASNGDLDHFADAISAGAKPVVPAVMGRFTITRYEILNNGAIVLYTKVGPTPNHEKWGFVRCPTQQADTGPAAIVGFEGEVGEKHRVQRMWADDWFVLFNRHDFINRGWP